MKKINNNKFRGNTVYSLNYKFDSISPAGKYSGTALDLIKRYNELAKEAQSNGDYVGMEVFRQYAEHYRKIVTEINERKYQARENQNANVALSENSETGEQTPVAENNLVETESNSVGQSNQEIQATEDNASAQPAEKPKMRRRRNFMVVEAGEPTEAENTANVDNNENSNTAETEEKPRRRPYVRKNKSVAEPAQA
ncbi:MAG: DUF4167 domain-containing protein [Alphaproteobacteria bacterium]|nr:DUF4167 domain-containing protein [Alphaproteobacteria bacterium]